MTGKDPNVTVNPDEVVALGAAVQAGVLAGGPAALLCWGRVLGVCGRVRLRCCAGGVCFGGVWSGPAALLLGACPGGRGRVWSGLAALLSWGRVPGGGGCGQVFIAGQVVGYGGLLAVRIGGAASAKPELWPQLQLLTLPSPAVLLCPLSCVTPVSYPSPPLHR